MAAATLGLASLPGGADGGDDPRSSDSQPVSQPTSAPQHEPEAIPIETTPPWLEDSAAASRVVEIHHAKVVEGEEIRDVLLGEMLTKSLLVLASATTAAEAWQHLLGAARRIVIKFNQVGAETLLTTDPLARAIVESLIEAGYAPATIALVEAPRNLGTMYGLGQASPEWGGEIRVLDTRVELAEYLYEADALINVPFVKTHRIAGMSGALKNLSHALIRHPARYHDNACSPYVGQIVGNREISSRLKLTIANTLRAVIRNGPEARPEDVVTCGQLLLGQDPVAVDAVGHELLMRQRRRAELDALFRVPYLEAAARDGVGRLNAHELDRIKIEFEGA